VKVGLLNTTRQVYNRVLRRFDIGGLLVSSSHLALSTLANSGIGYIYWIIAAHLFSPETVGASAALISILSLIATVAPLGLDASMVYILARSKADWPRKVYSFCLAIVAVTLLLAVLVLPFVDDLNKGATHIGASFEGGLIFVLTCLLWTFSLVVDELFTVEETTLLVLVRNALTSVLKLIFLPLALLFAVGDAPLFILAGWGLGALFAIGLSLAIFAGQRRGQLSFKPKFDFRLVRSSLKLSLGNYSIIMTQQIPGLILPVIVTQMLSAQFNAYFYTIFMFIQGVLLTIPLAISQAFFVQTAETDPVKLQAKTVSLLKIIFLSIVPLILASIFLRDQILGLFGNEYIVNGGSLLVIMSLGALPASFIRLYVSLQRIRGDFGRGLFATVGGLIAILLCTLWFIQGFGLFGVGLGWTTGLTIIAIGLGIDLALSFRRTPTANKGKSKENEFENSPEQAVQPPKLTQADLTVLNKKVFEGNFEPGDWQVKPLENKLVNPVSGGVFKVTGHSGSGDTGVERSAILKILKARNRGDNPHDWNYWKREALAYQSGLLENLPGGLKAPHLLGVVEKPDQKELWLWLEEVPNLDKADWTRERYGQVAHDLGLFNGAYLAGLKLPEYYWLSKRRSLTWVQPAFDRLTFNEDWLLLKLANSRLRAGLSRVFPGILNFGAELLYRRNLRRFLQPETWANPRVRQAFPQTINDWLLKIWGNHKKLLQILDSLPHTLCHLDAWNPNLITDPGPDGQDLTTAIDWEFVGSGAVGEELVQLVWCNLYYFNIGLDEVDELEKYIFEKYLEGLSQAGWKGDPRLVRLGYAASATLRWALSVPGLGLALDESRYGLEEQLWNRPIEQIIAHRAAMTYRLLDLADEVGRLVADLAPVQPEHGKKLYAHR